MVRFADSLERERQTANNAYLKYAGFKSTYLTNLIPALISLAASRLIPDMEITFRTTPRSLARSRSNSWQYLMPKRIICVLISP